MSFLDLNEKQTIVIDIGTAYTKCGLAGETGPHSILPTREASLLSNGKLVSIYDYKSLAKKENGVMEDDEVLKELLINFLYKIYYKILNANSRERKVVVVESILTPDHFRKVLADVLFKCFQAFSVSFIPSHLACLYTLGINIGLVIDCGYSDCQIMPIAEGVPLIGLCDFVNLGAKRIHNELESLIKEHSFVTLNGKRTKYSDTEHKPELTEKIIEDIKLRCCFVTNLERSTKFHSLFETFDEIKTQPDQANEKFKFAPESNYNLTNDCVLNIPGYVREMAFEILFVDKLDSEQTIQNLILNTIVKCPIDLKKSLLQNIVLIGGTCMLAGFKHRLVTELNKLINDESKIFFKQIPSKVIKFHTPPSQDNYTAWLGGAIFGSLDTLDSYSIPNLKYKDNEKIPDWFTVNTKNEMVHI